MKLGFIGLGIMGKHMSRNLVKAGHELVAYDVVPAALEALKADCPGKVEIASSAADVAGKVEIAITMLPNSPHVKSVVLGEKGIIETAKAGFVLIDMSSIDPMASKEIATELAKKGAEMLDAPVSGGEPKAADATLSVMVGGKKEVFDRCYEIMKAMSGSVVYIGDIGSGNVAKLANQIIVALNIAAVSEAMVLAKKAGASPELVYKAIRGGLAGSTVLDAKAPMMLDRNFNPGFRIELHIKDLMNALNAAHSLSVPLPLTSQVMEEMMALRADGLEKEDHSSLVKYYEKLSNVVVEP